MFLQEAYGHDNLEIPNVRGSPHLFGWFNYLLHTIA